MRILPKHASCRRAISAIGPMSAAMATVLLALGPASATRNSDIDGCGAPGAPHADTTSVSLDPIASTIRLDVSVWQDLSYSLQLPPLWREASRGAHEISFRGSKTPGALINIKTWSASDLPPGEADKGVIDRVANAFQTEHEAALGKPAQAVSLTPVPSLGAAKWTATWIDGNLDTTSHSFTTEAFLVELSDQRVLSMTFVNAGTAPARDALAGSILSTLTVAREKRCS